MFRLFRFALVVALLAAVTGTAVAAPFPPSIPLPDDFAPEGIAVGTGSTFYAGSLRDGDIYRGDLRSGAGAMFVDAPPGRQAVGLKVEESRHRLWVAGGITGHVYAYDTRTGATVADIALAPAGTALFNDVVVTRRGAFFTDSFNPVLYEVPIAPNGGLGAARTIHLSGPAATIVPGGFPNLNGIDATNDGSRLIVVHSLLASVIVVDPDTGASRTIQVTGGTITPGTPDGILLVGHSLWVVENFAERVVELRLSADLSHGTFGTVITDADAHGLFRVPTTAAVHGNQLAIVNARFDLGLPPPFGPGAPPGTDYDVVLVPRS
jgi:sugar lactone lactonase YvrE